MAIDACLAKAELSAVDAAAFAERIDAWRMSNDSGEEERAWQLRKTNLQGRIDRLTDALIDRLIERDAFAERRERLALEEEALTEERCTIGNRTKSALQLQRMLELAKSLALSHQLAEPAEKREMVEMATSNRRVSGKNVEMEPSSWLVTLKRDASVTCGDPARHRDRTEMLENLIAESENIIRKLSRQSDIVM